MKKNLLLVEDEDNLRHGLSLNFSLEGYLVRSAATLDEARAAVNQSRFDLIVLDLMLPDGIGLDLCRELRKQEDYTPILVLTARGRPDDVVAGLEAGADDYLAKPFHLPVLLSRVAVLLRRQRWEAKREPERTATSIGRATVDWDAHEFVRDGRRHRLTGLEVRLLAHFVDNQGRTLSRDALLRDVWGLTGYQTRTVDNFVARMRKYFEESPSKPRHFVTVRGAGYRFEMDE